MENKFNDLPKTEKWEIVKQHFYKTELNSEEFSSNHTEHLERHFELSTEWSPLRNYFFERLCAAEFHWFFVQGVDALIGGLYVPAVSSLMNGIEASLRVTLNQINNPNQDLLQLSPHKVLSNTLIKEAKESGLPIGCLAFPKEVDFYNKLESEKPMKISVEIVRQRNNVCHGNISEFINRDLGSKEIQEYISKSFLYPPQF